MADTPSIKIVHSTIYKGGNKTWSNRHHLSRTTPPADNAHWTTLVDNIVAAEKLTMCNETTYLEAVCYNPGSDLPVFTRSLSGAGALSGLTGEYVMPLEACALIRWSTDQRSEKNHPIYLFCYLHNILHGTSSDNELIVSRQKTTLDTYAAAWVSGFSDGAFTYKRAGPRGAVALGNFVDTHVTHRDFPR